MEAGRGHRIHATRTVHILQHAGRKRSGGRSFDCLLPRVRGIRNYKSEIEAPLCTPNTPQRQARATAAHSNRRRTRTF